MAIINTYPTATPKGSDLLIGTQVKDDTVEDNSTKSFTASSVAALALDYKAYVFSFTQSSTNDPVVTELENNTGLTFTFTRGSSGEYRLVGSSSFDTSKTWAQVTGGSIGSNTVLNIKNFQTDLIAIINVEVTTGNPIDGVDSGFVELRIYS